MSQNDQQAAVAAFIRSKGVTRCPTACALPTQGIVAAADRAALQKYAAERARSRHPKVSGPERLLRSASNPAGSGV